MNTPCHDDNRFISDSAKVLREAAKECDGCPVKYQCLMAGLGEPTGVWGGTVPTDEVRRLARKTYKGKAVCRNGHDVEEHGYPVDNLFPEHNNTPIMGCGVCVDRRRAMTDGLEASA